MRKLSGERVEPEKLSKKMEGGRKGRRGEEKKMKEKEGRRGGELG